MNRMKPLALALSIAATLVVPTTAAAGSVAGFGGSTEITQIANNVQLAASHVEQVRTAVNSARKYALMVQQLKRNPEGFAMGLLGGALEDHLASADDALLLVDSLQDLNRSMSGIHQEMDRAQRTMEELGRGGIHFDASQFYDAMIALAEKEGGEYRARIDAYQANLEEAQDEVQRINDIAARSDSLTTEIEGLQSVVSSNAVIAKMLAEQTLMVTEQRMDALAEKEAEAAAKKAAIEMRKRSDANLREALMRQFGADPGESPEADPGTIE